MRTKQGQSTATNRLLPALRVCSLDCGILTSEKPSYLKAYAAGSRLLFIPALAINALSCLKLPSHDPRGCTVSAWGEAELKCSLRFMHACVLCHASVRRCTASRSLKSAFVILTPGHEAGGENLWLNPCCCVRRSADICNCS